MSVNTEQVEAVILRLLAEAGDGKTVSPPDVARALEPSPEWHRMMTPIRRAAIALAMQGRIVIYRKGRAVDPNDFRGVYRLGLPRQDSTPARQPERGPGNSASVRPLSQ